MTLRLTLLPDRLAVCRLGPADPVPPWAHAGAWCSITRTPEELSIVCAEVAAPSAVRRQVGWRALVVAGPLDFALTGVVAALAEPLARAGVPIFVVSTFDTDYLLVEHVRLDDAIATLEAAGHEVAVATA